MSVLLLDYFNRTASDLTTSPVGRWAAPAGGGGVNAWRVDGQYARPGTTFGISTRGQLRWTGTSPGVDFGELRCRVNRGTTAITEIGIFVRAHRTDTAQHQRLAWVWNGTTSPTRWELRSYSAYGTYFLIQAFPDSGATGSGFVMGTNVFHDVEFRWTSIPNAPGLISMRAKVDTTFFSLPLWTDTWAALTGGLSAYRGFGCEVLTSAGFVAATDFALFDNIEFDDLLTPNAEPAPSLAADPTLNPISVATEGAAVDSLPFTPDIGERITQQWFTVRAQTEASYEVTWPRFQAGRLLWRIGHAALSRAEVATLETFLEDHAGPEIAFDYTDDLGATRTAFFVTQTFEVTHYGSDVARCEYVVEEAK